MIHTRKYYRDLAETYRLETVSLNEQLDEAMEQVKLIGEMMQNQAALASITREGGKLRFLFVRNGEPHVIETYGTWSDQIEKTREALLEKNDVQTIPDQ